MNQMGQLLGEIQREAAALPTGQLRAEIQVHLGVLTALVGKVQGYQPGAVSPDDLDDAKGDVIATALVAALYVRELTTRPAQRFARVQLSFN